MSSSLTYHTHARYIPAILASLPIQVLYYGTELAELDKLFSQISVFEIWKDLTMSTVVIYFFALFCRLIGKHVFEDRYYSDGYEFPTTKLVSWSDSVLPITQKRALHSKIFRDFKIRLVTENGTNGDSNESRKLIKAAIGQIITRVGDWRLTIERLIEYGFWRNLIGWSVIALPVSFIGAYIFRSSWALYWVFIMFAVISLCLITFSRCILDKHGKNYALTLLNEYLQA